MTTKAKRKRVKAQEQTDEKIVSLSNYDYSEMKVTKINPKFPFRFTKKQKEFLDLALDPKVKVLIVSGLAGTSKTAMSVYCALKMIQEQNAESITYVRSIVESSKHSLGFLPGDMVEKISPYMRPIEEKLEELLTVAEVKQLKAKEMIEAMPINFLRGLDFRPREDGKAWKVLILDEAQNLELSELVLFLSRLGENCKVFVCADPMQSDIRYSGFVDCFNLFDGEDSRDNGIYTFKFTSEDIVRSELVRFIISKYNNLKNS